MTLRIILSLTSYMIQILLVYKMNNSSFSISCFVLSSLYFVQWRLYLNTMKVGNKRGRIFNKEGEKILNREYMEKREWSEKSIGT